MEATGNVYSILNPVSDHFTELLKKKRKKFAIFQIQSILLFDSPKNYRDVFYQGGCDDGIKEMVKILDWQVIQTEEKCYV